jgi:dTDP-4-dehydrorhamnose 3,5-epimerase-like enzyme
MNFKSTRLAEVVLVVPKVFEDSRGFFMETWEARKFASAGIDPVLGIHWPLPAGTAPIVSDKDRAGKTLAEAEHFP